MQAYTLAQAIDEVEKNGSVFIHPDSPTNIFTIQQRDDSRQHKAVQFSNNGELKSIVLLDVSWYPAEMLPKQGEFVAQETDDGATVKYYYVTHSWDHDKHSLGLVAAFGSKRNIPKDKAHPLSVFAYIKGTVGVRRCTAVETNALQVGRVPHKRDKEDLVQHVGGGPVKEYRELREPVDPKMFRTICLKEHRQDMIKEEE